MRVEARYYAIFETLARWAIAAALALTLGTSTAAAQGPAVLAVEPAELQVQPGQEFDLDLAVYGVTELYAVEVQLVFEPGYLEVIDQDPVVIGPQVTIDTSFLKPDFVLENNADNFAGVIDVAYNQLPPSAAATGDGVLLRLRLRALTAGTVYVKLGGAVFAREDSTRMPVSSRAAEIRIGDSAPTEPTATQTATPTFTPEAPTETPTPPSTATPVVTDTPEPTATLPALEASPTAEEALTATPVATMASDGTVFESPLPTPIGAAGETGTWTSPLDTPTPTSAPFPEPTPTATATATPVKQAMVEESTPVSTPTSARVDPAAEQLQPPAYSSLAFIASVVGIIIVSFALFVVLPRGRTGRA